MVIVGIDAHKHLQRPSLLTMPGRSSIQWQRLTVRRGGTACTNGQLHLQVPASGGAKVRGSMAAAWPTIWLRLLNRLRD